MMFALISVLITGSLLTTRAMLAEPVRWRQPIVMALGLLLTVFAIAGVALINEDVNCVTAPAVMSPLFTGASQ